MKKTSKSIIALFMSVLMIITICPLFAFAADEECAHAKTEVRGTVEATCTAEGYTGDTYCLDCKTVIEQGKVVPMAAHQDTNYDSYCNVCNEKIAEKGGQLGVYFRYLLRFLYLIFAFLGKIKL